MPAVLEPPQKAKRTKTPKFKLTPPRPHRWTRSEYYELAKTNLFHDKKVMLIDGRIFVMPMPDPPHDFGLGTLDDLLRRLCPIGYHVRNQMGLGVGEKTDPGPDLAIVAGARSDYDRVHPTTALFVAEIADSSLRIDSKIKPHHYAAAGIPEYWVLDLVHRKLLVYRDPVSDPDAPQGFRYQKLTAFEPHQSISLLSAPQSEMKVSDLLPSNS